ncbi:unnamed protein product [Medioppia subpectinata]|uniref:Eukaryotic translation initiation factor 5A n=1 Tax=Medioppia subpectinata TaxID=1979941 RepID=A0A7R9PWD3_9ACAR|nr:unnamed protein product [Medioppia subpectinata]CAG2103213.1 unnamed protein product [Medioppia subpectinata]
MVLKVLAGDEGLKKAGKKVLESGPNDHVFVFFDDHGTLDIICFPHKALKAMDLLNTLKQMHHDKKYAKLVFYIKACFSGSMFYKILPTDIKIYATTAAKPDEGSDWCYYDEDINNHVGDTYSVNWMENTESATNETSFQDQFDYIKTHTPNSVAQQYGDLSIAKLPISLFLGKFSTMVVLAVVLILYAAAMIDHVDGGGGGKKVKRPKQVTYKDYDEVAASGASATYPVQCSTLRKNGFVMIKARPCKIMEMSTSKTGKHGHAKYEDLCPYTHNIDVPNVNRSDFQLIHISDDGFVTLKNDKGETRDDLRIPEGEMGQKIKDEFGRDNTVIVTVMSAVGEKAIIACKNANA